MKVTFITNGCAVFEAEGFPVLSDRLLDGAFEDSWCPPVRTRREDVSSVDAVPRS